VRFIHIVMNLLMSCSVVIFAAGSLKTGQTNV